MDRRSVLAAAGTGLAALSAGCAGISPPDQEPEFALGVYNESRESHSFRIRIGDHPGGGFFHEVTLELEGWSADEDIPFEGTPTRLYISIDDGDDVEYPWPASATDPGEIASKAEIYYDPWRDQEILVFG